jgi:hypothetical protein
MAHKTNHQTMARAGQVKLETKTPYGNGVRNFQSSTEFAKSDAVRFAVKQSYSGFV